MIVACPSCQTRYNLPDEKIPAKGLKVKCSKCEHVFKAVPPAPTPEEEALLDDIFPESPKEPKAPSAPSGSDFDAAFEEAVSQGDEEQEAGPEDFDAAFEDAKSDADLDEDEVFPGFDDADEKDDFLTDTDLGGDASDGLDDVFGDEESDDEGLGEGDLTDDSLGVDMDDSGMEDSGMDTSGMDDAGIFGDDLDEDNLDDAELGDVDLDEQDFDAPDKAAADDLSDDEGKSREDLFSSLGQSDDLDLEPRKSGGVGKFLLYVLLLLLLGGGAAVATFNYGLWSLPTSLKSVALELPFELPFKVPFIKGPDAPDEPVPGELPAERIKNIQPVDFRQYVITNEHSGPLFVVEGKALNKFVEPKERIKVLVSLFDEQGNVLASQEQMCGNTLSLLQLQVQTREEIAESLNSSAGIYANNSFIKPDQTTPFMVVFFDPPKNVKEYQIEIVDARDPKR
ncbi:MAG: DUF3426 domain-containing protein [Desulfovibrionaceae bacterium]